MSLKTTIRLLLAVFVISMSNSCKKKSKPESTVNSEPAEITVKHNVYNMEDGQAMQLFRELNLDETHPNLLNPQVSKSEYNSVNQSWAAFHQGIGNHLSENDFEWGVSDSSIAIMQKIYFTPDGEIKNYFFKILNEEVSEEKKDEFTKLIASFANENKIGIQRTSQFAQCGKTRYQNY